MHQAYGIDIRRPGCSLAHMACLAAQLGRGSRVLRAEMPELAWGPKEHLLADVVDSISMLRYELAGAKGKAPRMVDRPKAAKIKRETRAHAVSRERLDAILRAPRS